MSQEWKMIEQQKSPQHQLQHDWSSYEGKAPQKMDRLRRKSRCQETKRRQLEKGGRRPSTMAKRCPVSQNPLGLTRLISK